MPRENARLSGQILSASDETLEESRPTEPVDRPDRPSCGENEDYPPKNEILRQHELVITFYSVGCMVRVGCKSVAFSDNEEAMKEINEYVANPREATKKWNKIFNANE